ncbi:trimeric intracellular cation channel family protein [Pseudodonghicola flavimaris]|uniref:Trimeric intracellular cation channel family protein n=1 Tax=Pseudodonghicola flavimaris TaxID=3050036 RepID=A0ABT7F421_9RHOB|nr:trimeric intracellular cation channel family protein [Pseudodonghicola flavimaris]MDK3019235.1 trimeric intracellular cation channel family protein [Pseudodonghicola flavimaris]
MSAITLFGILDVLGTFVFGLSGAMVAIRRQLDIFGILVLAAATGVAGGIVRDLLLGDTPPAVFSTLRPLSAVCAAAVCAFFFGALIDRLKRPVMLFDAIGLGVFAVAGCEKALAHGLAAPGAILLGVITAIGGGMLRDMMATEVPRVLREEVYALAALAGAAIYVIALRLGLTETIAASAGVLLAVALRIASVRFGWQLPRAPGS